MLYVFSIVSADYSDRQVPQSTSLFLDSARDVLFAAEYVKPEVFISFRIAYSDLKNKFDFELLGSNLDC